MRLFSFHFALISHGSISSPSSYELIRGQTGLYNLSTAIGIGEEKLNKNLQDFSKE